jgi:hypothetical protein
MVQGVVVQARMLVLGSFFSGNFTKMLGSAVSSW